MRHHLKNSNPAALLASIVMLSSAVVAMAQERVRFPENERRDLGFTFSDGGEFKVTGVDAFTRGTFSDFAVSERSDFNKLLNFGSKLKYPIIINLEKVPGNRDRGLAVKPVAVTGARYSPNVYVKMSEAFREEDLRRELTNFFLLDYALRRNRNVQEIVEKRGGSIIPNWLLVGVTEAIGFKQDGEPSELFAAVFQSGKILSVDDILTADAGRMNSLSAAIYRASAGGLVLTLLQQDGGTARMRNFIDALATAPPDQEALVRKFFPGISDSNNSLEKWWALQAAELAKPTTLDVLSIKETESGLVRALRVAVMESDDPGAGGEASGRRVGPLRSLFQRSKDEPRDGAGEDQPVAENRVVYNLDEFAEFVDREDIGQVLGSTSARLQQLSFRCFPLHRPLIGEYLAVIEQIIDGRTKGVAERLASLAQTREGLARSGQMAEDVMNLQSITGASHLSGTFDSYFRLFERLRNVKPKRSDEISDYLDRVQAEYE